MEINYRDQQVPTVKDIARLVKGRKHLAIECYIPINFSMKDLSLIKQALRIYALPSARLILPYYPLTMQPGELLPLLVETQLKQFGDADVLKPDDPLLEDESLNELIEGEDSEEDQGEEEASVSEKVEGQKH